ncbi:hypothetical protein QN277_028707 [Acacia crassicarpa]|uniref:Peptidoglycan binding-like domain-containing protein n=1 Tax=Acacia crassicarpa TaxID=499986 RepID=A0AAE1J3T8_9FABA|nr:hypothetical protein QN277_028707 [Acacia crassicarpa]
MRVTKRACIVFLILSLLIVDESSILLRPASANLLFNAFRLISNTLKLSKIFSSLNNLRSFLRSNGGRIRIGNSVDGISKIKDYFELFGYLNSTLNSNFTDEFSPALESAIKSFQRTFNLNVTGQPDDATVSLITLLRCALKGYVCGWLPPVVKRDEAGLFRDDVVQRS